MEFLKLLKKEYKPLLIILILFLINVFLFNHKMINVHTDFGREVLFSVLVSKGAVVYRDMFNTFLCPFSYLINGLLLKIFPVHLNTFYFAGAINAFLILVSVYFISRNFLNRAVSTAITVFVMFYCCFYAGLMNFLMPYSYAIVYGLCACLLSVLLFLKYLKTDRKTLLYCSFFFAGIGAANKYEFILYALFLFVFLIILKKENLKTVIISLASMFVTPILCVIFLLIEGLKFVDIKNYWEIFSSFIHQPYLKKVYEATFYFNPHSLIYLARCFVTAGFIFFLGSKFFENKSKEYRLTGYFALALLILCVLVSFDSMKYYAYDFFSFAPILILTLTLLKFKQIIKDKPVLFLAISSLVISTKSFWMLITNFYGRYFLPLVIIALIVILKKYYICTDSKKDEIFSKTVCFILIFLSFASFRLNLVSLVLKNTPIQTHQGTIFEQKKTAANLNFLIKFIQNNTSQKDTLIVLGDAPLLNFLTNRKSLDLYSHFDEAIFSAYGEDRIINAYEKAKPEYFIVTKTFCKSYGKGLCSWLNKDYKLIETKGDEYGIYKKRL